MERWQIDLSIFLRERYDSAQWSREVPVCAALSRQG